jgi:multiple sugar transport system substrate-binding protein
LDAGTDAETARQYALSVRDALSHEAHLIAPRIPCADRYMAVLDAAVAEAVSGASTAEAALSKAAAEWIKITDELGRDKQRAAYRKSLGLDP